MQVKLSKNEKKHQTCLTSMSKTVQCDVAQEFHDCQHLISYAPRVPLSYGQVKTNIADKF